MQKDFLHAGALISFAPAPQTAWVRHWYKGSAFDNNSTLWYPTLVINIEKKILKPFWNQMYSKISTNLRLLVKFNERVAVPGEL